MQVASAVVFAVEIAIGICAIAIYYFSKSKLNEDTEFFLTARNTQPWYRVGWGLFGSVMGAWVVFSVSAFALYGGGILGLAIYAIFCGIPLLLVGYIGSKLKTMLDRPISIASFASERYGKIFQVYVSLNVLFNLSIAMAVEYTSIGSLFVSFLDTPAYAPILVVGLVTMIYTMVGGLYVSILTDQLQAILTLLLVVVVSIFLAINFRVGPFPSIDQLPPGLGITEMGYESIVTIGLALVAATMFSDAVWQRVWAAQDNRALQKGVYFAAGLATVVAFFFGFGGYVAGVYGLIDLTDINQVNASFFGILKSSDGTVSAGILAVVALLTAVMNQSAIDSFQNAILDTILSVPMSLGISVPVNVARFVVVLINVPLMYLGTLGLSINSLFLVTNMLTTCTMLPLLMGLFPVFDFVGGTSAVLGSLLSLFAVMLHGYIAYGSWTDGIVNNFYAIYWWQPFIVGLVSSFVLTILFGLIERRLVYKIKKTPTSDTLMD
ncbi:hypothetical protein EDD86DRAFT_92271 [Gorgonomyces haynaldii]|nr:hypothetical protein EDD86DRAFT_92271 [Gorgonomyces haynaldii]